MMVLKKCCFGKVTIMRAKVRDDNDSCFVGQMLYNITVVLKNLTLYCGWYWANRVCESEATRIIMGLKGGCGEGEMGVEHKLWHWGVPSENQVLYRDKFPRYMSTEGTEKLESLNINTWEHHCVRAPGYHMEEEVRQTPCVYSREDSDRATTLERMTLRFI